MFSQRLVLQAVDVELTTGENFKQFEIIIAEEIESLVGTVVGFHGFRDSFEVLDTLALVDESGMEERWYGRLGETAKELRQVNASSNPVSRTLYQTGYVFDSFGRMIELTYPDGEVLTYLYDTGGLLKRAEGVKRGNRYVYVDKLLYDEFGQRTEFTYGNNVKTTYAYDPLTRRLTHLWTKEPTKGRVIQDIVYAYDLVGNILDITNTAPIPAGGEIGGPTEHHYTYDDLYQLTTANGLHQADPGKKTNYTNNLAYDTIGNITGKIQTHLILGTNGSQQPRETNYNMTYLYNPQNKPHAVRDAGDKLYSYDDNGNMTGWTSKTTNSARTIIWNEENRVKSISDFGSGTAFLYDDSGERVVKGGGGNETVYLNRFYSLKNGDLGSKHVFAGETRVCTKLEKDGGSITSGVPGTVAIINSQGILQAYNRGRGSHRGIGRRLVTSGTTTTSTGTTDTTTTNPPTEKFAYFYHPDHLGSSSFITDDYGAVYQELEYFPYGETWVEEGGSGQMPMYRFTGKELDPETGLYYYGARYFDPVLSRWISADPILEKYLPNVNDTRQTEQKDWKPERDLPGIGGVFNPINMNMYSYAGSNPIKFVDPDGNDIELSIGSEIKEINVPQSAPAVVDRLVNNTVNPAIRDINKVTQHTIRTELQGSVKIAPSVDNNKIGGKMTADFKLGDGTFSMSGEVKGSGNVKATTGYTIPLTKEFNLTIGGEYSHDPSLVGAPGDNVGKISISIGSGGNNSSGLPSLISNKLPEPTRIDMK